MFDDIRVGHIVSVYWRGEKEWYEGEVLEVDHSDSTVKVVYKSDSTSLWHKLDNYPMKLLS